MKNKEVIALESFLRYKTELRNMFESEQRITSKYGQVTSGPASEDQWTSL